MINKLLLNKLYPVMLLLLSIFTIGYFKGKGNEQIKQTKKAIKAVRAIKKRKKARLSDDVGIVKQRLYNNTRDK